MHDGQEVLRSTRVQKLKIKDYKSKIMTNDIEIVGAKVFNSLPAELRNIESLNVFKTRLKSFLLSKSGSLSSIQQLYTKNLII